MSTDGNGVWRTVPESVRIPEIEYSETEDVEMAGLSKWKDNYQKVVF